MGSSNDTDTSAVEVVRAARGGLLKTSGSMLIVGSTPYSKRFPEPDITLDNIQGDKRSGSRLALASAFRKHYGQLRLRSSQGSKDA